MGTHARLPGPLLLQVPALLGHPGPTAPSPTRYQAKVAQAQRSGQPLDVRDLEAQLLADDDETTLVVGSWAYQGSGWSSPGDEALALAAAARAREYDQWRATQRKTALTNYSGEKPRTMETRAVAPVLYRVDEAAQALRLSRSVIYELIRSGRLRTVKEGRSRRVPVDALAEYVASLEAA